MKTTLLLNDETAQARLLLKNPAPAKVKLPQPEAAVGCSCDRWGHSCPDCGHSNVELKVERPFSLPLDE